jgi:hypothetical protein
MVFLVRPILFSFLKSKAVKKLIVDLLKALAKTTDNTVDDQVGCVCREKPVSLKLGLKNES